MSKQHTIIDSPIGNLTVVADAASNAIVEILFDGVEVVDSTQVPTPMPTDHVLSAATTQLAEYFAGDRTDFDLPLAPNGTDFQRAAWTYLTTIPHGTTTTYGEQAAALGDRNKSRAVGAANGKNPIPIVVPCHRVVGANGSLTGFAGGIDVKSWLLDHEQGTQRLL